MNIRLQRISLGKYVADLLAQITEGLKLKKSIRRTRKIDLQQLYWMNNHTADPEGASNPEHRMEGDVDSAEYWLMKGEALIRQEQLSEANFCFEQVLRHEPCDVYALTYTGYCLYKLGQSEKALSILQQVAGSHPRNAEINIIKALCLCQMHQFEVSLIYFTKALRHGLESPVLWNNKGFCLARLGRYREASTAFKIAMSKCGEESLEILCNAASVLVEAGANNQALAYFDKALLIDAEDHVLLNNVAFCLEALGRHDQAMKCYERALLLDPGNLTYLYNQGLCLVRQQRWDQAFTCLKEVVGQDPGNGIAWCGLAAAFMARGEAEEALACYNKALAPVG